MSGKYTERELLALLAELATASQEPFDRFAGTLLERLLGLYPEGVPASAILYLPVEPEPARRLIARSTAAGRPGRGDGLSVAVTAGSTSLGELQLRPAPDPSWRPVLTVAARLIAAAAERRLSAEGRPAVLDRILSELHSQKFALDQVADVSVTDRDGRILYVNDRMVAITGYSRAELIGDNHRLLHSGVHKRAFFAGLWRTVRAGRVWRGDVCNRMRDGHLRWFDTTVVPFMDETGEPYQYVAIRTDITDRVLMEEELTQARDEARESARLRSEFIANMSHEVRTPMTGLLGSLAMLEETLLDEEQQELLQTAIESGSALLGSLNSILDYSRMAAGHATLERQPFRLLDPVDAVMRLFRAQAVAKGVGLRLVTAAGVPEAVSGDAERLRQVLANLVGNAIKFTAHGEVTLRLEAAGDGVRFEVADTGIGIAPEAVAAIFEPFRQADGSHARRYGGSGLGLAICRALVAQMGGGIEVDSAPGRGSRFVFRLRLPPVDPALVAPRPEATPAAELPLRYSGRRVLVVDDNPVNRSVLDGFLARLGLTVEQAADGEEALRRIAAAPPALVLLDAQMPGLDGFEVARRIRALPPPAGRLPLIAVSAGMAEFETEWRRAGMDAALDKPIRRAQLRAVLRRFLGDGLAVAPAGMLDEARLSALAGLAPAERRAVLEAFLRDGRERIAALEAGADGATVRRVAHALKGSALNLGAAALARQAAAIEAAAAVEPERLAEMRQTFEHTAAALRQHL